MAATRAGSGWRCNANDGENALDLTLVPLKPPAIHGIGGVSRKAACASCASHYYSYTRIATRGTLTYQGLRLPVSGISWMDHEFGSRELSPDEARMGLVLAPTR